MVFRRATGKDTEVAQEGTEDERRSPHSVDWSGLTLETRIVPGGDGRKGRAERKQMGIKMLYISDLNPSCYREALSLFTEHTPPRPLSLG